MMEYGMSGGKTSVLSGLWSAELGSVPGTEKSGYNPRSGFMVNRYQRGGQMREGQNNSE
jgi:hypothetical protein